jgi:NTE family protein
MPTAFVLSGGASLGAVQVGMLQALGEHGISPDLLIGTSVGALNAAWYAGHPGSVEPLAAIWRGLKRGDVFPIDRATTLLGLFGRRDHLISASGLRSLLDRHLNFERLEDAAIPLHVVATDLGTGREIRLSRGDAIPAILASAAIPGIFPPVRVRGRDLIDGGIAGHAAISQAVALGATRVYVLPTGYACALARAPSTALAMALHAVTLVLNQRLMADIRRVQDSVELHVLPPLCPLAVSPADFGRAGELIQRSYAETMEWLSGRRSRRGQAGLLAFHPSHRRSS